MEPVRDASTGYVTERRMPARRFRLSYMLTCWTQRPEDEHRLLAACLSTFVRNEFIPRDLTAGSLAESPFPVLLNVCLPTPPERSIADVWSALGGELKPSLDLSIIAPLLPERFEDAGPPVTEEPVLVMERARDAEVLERVGGRPVPAERRTAPVDLRPPPPHPPDRRRRRR
jgi:hypothetical protein